MDCDLITESRMKALRRDAAKYPRDAGATLGRQLPVIAREDFFGLCKHMISRQLRPFCMFFGPFLSHKGIDFSPVTKKQGLFKFAERRANQNAREKFLAQAGEARTQFEGGRRAR